MKYCCCFLLSLLSALTACRQDAGRQEKRADKPLAANDLGRYLKDSLLIDKTGYAFENSISLVSGEAGTFNLSVFKVQDGSLYLYNIDKRVSRFIGRFPVGRAAFFVTGDTVFAWISQTKALDIYLLTRGKKPRKLQTLHFPDQGKDKRYKFDVYPADIPFGFNRNGVVMLETLPRLFHVDDSTLYYQSQSLAVFKRLKDTILLKQQLAPYPEAYRKTFIGGNSHFSNCLKTDDTIAYLYNNAPLIYEYDTHKQRLIYFPVSGLPVNTTSKYDCSQCTSFQYDLTFHIENDWYVKLLYDRKHDRYLIFRVTRIARTRPDGTLAEWDDKPADLFVVGKGRRVEHTYHLSDQHKYFLHQSFVYNGFLYLVRNVNNNGDQLIADKYEI